MPPHQVVDFLALVGDTSDNIPGVKGIGEKGAQKLLAEYGDLETILARAGEVSAKRTREALLAQADAARLSQELVTIKRDVPVELDVADLVLQEPDREAALRLLTELEFFSLAKRLGGQGGAGAAPPTTPPMPATPEPAFEPPSAARSDAPRRGRRRMAASATAAATATLPATADDWLALDEQPALEVDRRRRSRRASGAGGPAPAAPLVALDAETSAISRTTRISSVCRWRPAPRGLVSAVRPPAARGRAGGARAGEEPASRWRDFTMAPLFALLEDPAVPKAGHNIKYDWQVLRRAGSSSPAWPSTRCSRASSSIRAGAPTRSTRSAWSTSAADAAYADLAGKGKAQVPFAEVPVAGAAAYCGADSATVLALHDHLRAGA